MVVSVWDDDDSDDIQLHGAIVKNIVMIRMYIEPVKNTITQ